MYVSPVNLSFQVPEPADKTTTSGKGGFSGFLSDAINELNRSQVQADQITEKFIIGEVENLHQVTIAMEKAKLNMQLAVQVRNKIVEAYQEISRIQI